MKKKILILVILGLIMAVAYLTVPYFYCLSKENEWIACKTVGELENNLLLYSKSTINPSDSDWGNDYVLQSDEKMVRYMVLYLEPVDVVTNASGDVLHLFLSYE
jgi:hypothetical protein